MGKIFRLLHLFIYLFSLPIIFPFPGSSFAFPRNSLLHSLAKLDPNWALYKPNKCTKTDRSLPKLEVWGCEEKQVLRGNAKGIAREGIARVYMTIEPVHIQGQ